MNQPTVPEELAGEPEVVMWQWRRKSDQWTMDKSFYVEVKATTDDSEVRELITLQSHREIVSAQALRYLALDTQFDEMVAKKDAALRACVEALKLTKEQPVYGHSKIDAAIAQAEKELK
jgi:hypothetical protein